MRVMMLGVLAALVLVGCTPEGAVNKAKQTPDQQIQEGLQREQERSRIIQDSQRAIPPTTTR